MRLAIMQPYLFPYVGYYQLFSSVDKFVFYDDVNFIKKGWINRNKILGKNGVVNFTVPCCKVSQNVTIKNTAIVEDSKVKLLNKIENCYRQAPFYSQRIPLIKRILGEEHESIGALAEDSITFILNYFDVETEFKRSSLSNYNNNSLAGQNRILDIVKREEAHTYHNLPGGKSIYRKDDFLANNVNLRFIMMREISYSQFNSPFSPGLSFIDNLMFNNDNDIKEQLTSYTLE